MLAFRIGSKISLAWNLSLTTHFLTLCCKWINSSPENRLKHGLPLELVDKLKSVLMVRLGN